MSNSIKFVEGQFVSVFEPKGLRNKKSGLGTSERLDQDGGPNVMPEEKLKVVKKLGSTEAWCEREDGTQIRVHLNHINATAPYNISKKAPSVALTPAQKVEALKAQLAAAQAALDDAQIDLELARGEAQVEAESVEVELEQAAS